MPTTLEYYNRETHDLEPFEVTFEYLSKVGRYNVRRADNRRLLGWVSTPTKFSTSAEQRLWSAHVTCGAFRGTGPDDEGYILDFVPGHLYNSSDGTSSPRIISSATRREAAEELLSWLHKREAPAMGFGAHPSVRPWKDRA